MSARAIKSILALDMGSVHTRALLFDVVDGAYQLVAQCKRGTSAGLASQDAPADLVKLLQEIAEGSGRQLLDEDKRLIRPRREDGAGVDYCLTTTSAGPTTRACLIGLYETQDIAAARRAIAPYYVDVVAQLHLEDGLSQRARLNRIVHSLPQLVLVTGGTDGGARAVLLEMLALLRQALDLSNSGSRPTIVYAGNSSLSATVREMLAQQVEVLVAPNIRQGAGFELEGVQRALGEVFDANRSGNRRFARAAAESDSGIMPSAKSLETMAAFFSRQASGPVILLDMGSARSQVSLAQAGTAHSLVRNDIGLGHSAASTLDRLGEETVAAWLPFQPRRDELTQYALDKGINPGRKPLDMRERAVEYALLRAGLRFMLAELEARESQLPDSKQASLALLAGGAFTGSGTGALDMMLLADALRPVGVMSVKADTRGALAALGALAQVQPQAVVQLLNSDALEHVGSLIRLSGKGARGDTGLKISLRHANGKSVERELAVGDIWHVPLPASEIVDIRLQTPRGLAINGKRSLRLQLPGGRGGLLFDARLDTPEAAATLSERAVNMLRWFAAVSGDGQRVVVPESWLAGRDG